MNKKNNRKGFTIVELVIVIAVIAILATALVPTFGNVIGNANKAALLQEVKNAYTAYTVEKADDEGYTDSIYIQLDGKYYQVTDGEIVLENDAPKAVGRPTEANAVIWCVEDKNTECTGTHTKPTEA